MTEAQKATLRAQVTTVGRMLMGILFVFSGIGILMNGVAGTADYFSLLGVPLAGIMVWLVIAVKILAGGALMLGYEVERAAIALIIFTLLATWVAHMDLEDVNLFKNLAIVGGLLYVWAYGPGNGWKLRI